MVDDPRNDRLRSSPATGGAIAKLRAELEQRARDVELLAERIDALKSEIERLQKRIGGESGK